MEATAKQIMEEGAKAEKILRGIKQSGSLGIEPELLHKELKTAICLRLMIHEEDADTDELRKLCILSIRRQTGSGAGLPEEVIQNQIEKYDCHQTNLVSQKKVLLMMFVEKILGVRLEDGRAAEICTVRELAKDISDLLRNSPEKTWCSGEGAE